MAAEGMATEATSETPAAAGAAEYAAEHALHDEPLDCGARPCELSAPPHAAALEALGLHHGAWVRAAGQNTAAAAADVTLVCAITDLAPLPELSATLPPLVLASYDIECSAGAPDAAGNYAFPNAFKPDHAVRCVAVAMSRATTRASLSDADAVGRSVGPPSSCRRPPSPRPPRSARARVLARRDLPARLPRAIFATSSATSRTRAPPACASLAPSSPISTPTPRAARSNT